MARCKELMKYAIIVCMVIACIIVVMHWGFMGVVIASCIYGLWAVNSEGEEGERR
jgi:uncharacterized MnhB-related membrane protein